MALPFETGREKPWQEMHGSVKKISFSSPALKRACSQAVPSLTDKR